MAVCHLYTGHNIAFTICTHLVLFTYDTVTSTYTMKWKTKTDETKTTKNELGTTKGSDL